MTAAPRDARADRVAARATGVGVGVLAFMIAWLVGARVTEQLWGPPSSAVVAMAFAVVAGILVSIVAGHRLTHRQHSESQRTREPTTHDTDDSTGALGPDVSAEIDRSTKRGLPGQITRRRPSAS